MVSLLPAPLLPLGSLLDGLVALKLWNATKAVVGAFYAAEPPWVVPQTWLVPLLVAGAFLVVAGTAFASHGKGKFWTLFGCAAGAAVGAWIFMGGSREISTFFVVILLVLKFLGGVTFVLGIFRSFWIPAAFLLAVILGATAVVDPAISGRVLGVAASVLGVYSLMKKAEEFSPGRKGSTWNRRTSVGWVICLLAAGMLEASGLGAHGGSFKLAGMVIGAALVVLSPSLMGSGVQVKLGK